MLTSVCNSAPGTGVPVAASSSCACSAETTSAYWMPADFRPALAGHVSVLAGVGSFGAERPLGDRHVGIGERVPVHPPVGRARRVADPGAEDVGTVFVGLPGRVAEAAVDRGERGDFLFLGDAHGTADRSVVVVKEVRPQARPAGQQARARRVREVVGERPFGSRTARATRVRERSRRLARRSAAPGSPGRCRRSAATSPTPAHRREAPTARRRLAITAGAAASPRRAPARAAHAPLELPRGNPHRPPQSARVRRHPPMDTHCPDVHP